MTRQEFMWARFLYQTDEPFGMVVGKINQAINEAQLDEAKLKLAIEFATSPDKAIYE